MKTFTLVNDNGAKAVFTDYGAAITSFFVPDAEGKLRDIVLGCDSYDDYKAQNAYLGAIAGRCANRIRGGEFTLNGTKYQLAKNDGENHLHGGESGFDKRIWDARESEGQITFSRESSDLEEGYPGKLRVSVSYKLGRNNALQIDYEAETDKPTVCNLTNHAYFNLNGHSAGEITSHYLRIFAGFYTPTDCAAIPDGSILSVEGTPLDFRKQKMIADGIDSDFGQIAYLSGFDVNFALDGCAGFLREAAAAYSVESGISLRVYTTMPGIQFYSGNHLSEVRGKNGAVYGKRNGFCLETQFFPNSLEYGHFPSPILRPGEKYIHTTVYQAEASNILGLV